MRKFMNAAAVLMGGAALVAATQGSANAATTATTAPSCVTYQEILMVTIGAEIKNGCSTTQNVTVEYKSGVTDSQCYTIKPGGTARSYVPFNISHVNRLVTC